MGKKIIIYGDKPLYEGYLNFLEKVLIPLLDGQDLDQINERFEKKIKPS
ncbi:hypothetical protein SBV1_gp34 [Sulfolobales Beppu virus 1]|nr:hypothetical protein SBV1_gp34 [Sulfolobales Beppu virus 1]